MKRFSQSLEQEMDDLLRSIHSNKHEPIAFCVPAITGMAALIDRLKTFVIDYEFKDSAEEIFLFRNIKPLFTSRLIYYREVYKVELSMPVGDRETERSHYKNEMDKLKSFFAQNFDFYRYYRSGATDMDEKYFRRGKVDFRLAPDVASIQADSRFSTSHDYVLSHLLANEDICRYLEGRLSALADGSEKSSKALRVVTWTGSKVALVELLYALHAEGVLNGGNINLKDFVDIFEGMFNINLGQYHKTFLEIRERKSERAKFLQSLRETFVQRMESTDEL
ncbi:RteC domain-containing protein [Flavobacterium sp.]|uniref:RteC domain-containing protein n=1 Tax=Flavobacterium sp. TaxID=239 RepID=UPI0012269A0D|nr:RteC domain-containing protein [Flavobacterium sp.]RZJ71765.1 MAG: tetracycline regulation of excision, RteC [Flavobacterium sp.]